MVNMATEDLMYDSDAHVNMSRITSEALNLSDDSECSPSPAAQPSPEVPPLPPLPLSEAPSHLLQTKTSPESTPFVNSHLFLAPLVLRKSMLTIQINTSLFLD